MGMTETASRGRAGRVPGYDLARGVAVLVMVVLNVTGVLASSGAHTGWLDLALGFLDRRAAAALMMISGAGISLYARAAWTAERQRALIRRGIFLVMAGLLLSLIWSGDILHVYGVLICLGALGALKSTRVLTGFGLVCFALGGLRWTPLFDALEEGGSWMWEGAADLLFTGYFPLFPWAALFTAGMLLGRLNLGSGTLRAWLWGAALAAFFLGEGTALIMPADWARTDLALPTLTGMVSGMGTGLGLVLGAMEIAGRPYGDKGRDRAQGRMARHVAAVGRTSLSFYILHILFLVGLVPLAGREGVADLWALSGAAILFYAAYARLAVVWLDRAGRGPFEMAMRRFPFIRRSVGSPVLSAEARS